MTAPDRIIMDCGYVPTKNSVAIFSEWGKPTEYVRADLSRSPAEAHPLASEARTALERDDVAGWIGSLPKAPLAEVLAVQADAIHDKLYLPGSRFADLERWRGYCEGIADFRDALRAIGERADG